MGMYLGVAVPGKPNMKAAEFLESASLAKAVEFLESTRIVKAENPVDVDNLQNPYVLPESCSICSKVPYNVIGLVVFESRIRLPLIFI
jgi:hypothetical protein